MDAEYPNYSQQGDAWRCAPTGKWAPGNVVQKVLGAAIGASLKPAELQAVTHELNARAQLELDASELAGYRRRIAKRQLMGLVPNPNLHS